MALEGLHHITAITADAPGNVDFYTRVLGLRMVKKTVNFDAPDVYHLYYGDEVGTPGSILTFFEFPDAARGRAGDGMVHRILWRVGSEAALEFWKDRLGAGPVFADPEGLEHELVVFDGRAGSDSPLSASRDDIPAEHAIQGFHGVRAFGSAPDASTGLLTALGFEDQGDLGWRLGGDARHAFYHYDAPPPAYGVQGAGTIHHVAWSAADDDELAEYRARATAQGAHATHVIDRQYFHSVYFREPSGVLFELATRDVGFDVDEPIETLGRELKLPAQHEHLRAHLEHTLTPLP
jgi:glyoxalase family protein